MRIEVEKADWTRNPGRYAIVAVGPFWFVARTSDRGNIGFSICFGRWQIGWFVEADSTPS